jgi:hypothetical protein
VLAQQRKDERGPVVDRDLTPLSADRPAAIIVVQDINASLPTSSIGRSSGDRARHAPQARGLRFLDSDDGLGR